MVRIEAPQQHRLQHTKHHRGQVGTPYAARAVVVFAAHHRGAQYPFRRVVVHGHFRTLNKDRKTAPVVVEALQDLMLGTVPVWLVKMALTASLHLAQLALQVKMVLHKSWRLLVHRQRRVPHLESGRIESVEGSDIVDPDPHPVLQLWPTPRRLEKIPPHMRPAIRQNELVIGLGQAFVGAVAVTHQYHFHEVLLELGKMGLRHIGPTPRGHAVKTTDAEWVTQRYQRCPVLPSNSSQKR